MILDFDSVFPPENVWKGVLYYRARTSLDYLKVNILSVQTALCNALFYILSTLLAVFKRRTTTINILL